MIDRIILFLENKKALMEDPGDERRLEVFSYSIIVTGQF